MIGNLLRAALLPVSSRGACSAPALTRRRWLSWAAASTRRPTPRRLPMRSLSRPDGVITAIGSRSEVQIPADARIIDCTGKTVVAGFWNSHVHFTQAVWKNAAHGARRAAQAHMREMLTRWGFTTVWDLGSDPEKSLPLRRRVNAGEMPRPGYLPAGSIFPKGGHPAYLPRRDAAPRSRHAGGSRAIWRGPIWAWGWTA